MSTRAEVEHERLNRALERIAALEDALKRLVGEVQAHRRHIVGLKPREERKMDYMLLDLDTGTARYFEDIQEARATAEKLELRHWMIQQGSVVLDQQHRNGRFIDVRKRYAEVIQALNNVPREQVLNLINLWAREHVLRGDLLEELEESPVVWMRASDLGEDDE